MARPKERIYLVAARDGAHPEGTVLPRRLVKGTRADVENYILGGLVIEPATQEEMYTLGKAGAVVEVAA
jgi:hypothetical protein